MGAVPCLDGPHLLGEDLGLEDEWNDEEGGGQHAEGGVDQGQAPGPAGQRRVPVLDGVLDGVEPFPGHQHRQERRSVQQHRLARVEEVGEEQVEETVLRVADPGSKRERKVKL